MPAIAGYSYGSVPRSPVSLEDFERMKRAALFGEEDVKWLRVSREVLEGQIEPVLDVWYGFVGSLPHLVSTFAEPGGAPDARYLAAVRARFGQWILDTAAANYDQRWLDWQHEIGLRHHRAKKGQTDAAPGGIVPFKYLWPLLVPVTTTLKPFLAKRGHSAEDVEKMHAAWVKSVVLQLTLWSHPYVRDADF